MHSGGSDLVEGRHQRLSACNLAGRTLMKDAIRGYQHAFRRVGP